MFGKRRRSHPKASSSERDAAGAWVRQARLAAKKAERGGLFALPPDEFLVELTYRAFKYNRTHSPEITVEQWELTLPHARQMEECRLREQALEDAVDKK